MTSPESASPSRPAKAAGFALLGVAAVALVIGVVSLFGGGSDDTPPVAEGTSSTAPPAQTSTAASEPPASTPSSAPPATTTATPTVPSSAVVPPPPVTQPGAAKAPVRVYNNSTITGLATKASDEVRANGWTVAETGNYSSGTIPTTTVYFRPGTEEEASAKELAAALRARVEPRFDGIQSAAAGIILIVTNDFQGSAKNK
ncbi:LytR C-terminal domain-containing protein [Lentzea sp. BCCO 10_0061]|uniref:LytR C-terminal domain-containing protein n=1 Tax=Lentzea sokolovensis TaxID=3095429 RepID=A0ABU4UY53_9PSEU|nr:LytR C-terminal domain-containing protein [Lentzea sp. BCCO 10_0061]MDX8143615.1 LytR C-terminal domain-containing protein [Lentzea sp. BCCO 10_0061]